MKTKIVRGISTFILTVLAGLAFAAGSININTADADTLASELKGVGSSKAEAIVAYRAENGPFKAVEDLSAVKGIGGKVLQDNLDKISIED